MVEAVGPGPAFGIHPQGPQQHGVVPQGQPAPAGGCVFVVVGSRAVGGGQGPCWGPVANGHQRWLPLFVRNGHIHHQLLQILAVCELGQLLLEEGQKPLGDLHLSGDRVCRRIGSNVRRTGIAPAHGSNLGKSLKILGIDQYFATRLGCAAVARAAVAVSCDRGYSSGCASSAECWASAVPSTRPADVWA